MSDKGLKSREGAGGYHSERSRRERFDPHRVNGRDRGGRSERFMKKRAFPQVALDQMHIRRAQDRQHDAGKARARSDI